MRVEGDFIVINKWLLPLSWLYGLGVKLRNFAFEAGILKSRAFDVPVISVGNITVGGTGKTPHVEYLTKLLRELFHVAVLSRGYKRKTRGFIIADKNTTMPEIGDEPFQMKQKFPDVTVAVDKKRCHGIDKLTANDKELDVILLDTYQAKPSYLASELDIIRQAGTEEDASFDRMLSRTFYFIEPKAALAKAGYDLLRSRNLFTHRIARPLVRFYLTEESVQGGPLLEEVDASYAESAYVQDFR